MTSVGTWMGFQDANASELVCVSCQISVGVRLGGNKVGQVCLSRATGQVSWRGALEDRLSELGLRYRGGIFPHTLPRSRDLLLFVVVFGVCRGGVGLGGGVVLGEGSFLGTSPSSLSSSEPTVVDTLAVASSIYFVVAVSAILLATLQRPRW